MARTARRATGRYMPLMPGERVAWSDLRKKPSLVWWAGPNAPPARPDPHGGTDHETPRRPRPHPGHGPGGRSAGPVRAAAAPVRGRDRNARPIPPRIGVRAEGPLPRRVPGHGRARPLAGARDDVPVDRRPADLA